MNPIIKQLLIIFICAYLVGAFLYLGSRTAKMLWPEPPVKVETKVIHCYPEGDEENEEV